MNTLSMITEIENGLNLLQNQQDRLRVINNYFKFKIDTPFSRKLNQFIEDWYDKHADTFIFTDTDDFDENDMEGTLQKHVQRYKDTGKIQVWTGASEGTIFGNPTINHKFRAWHDYIHVTNEYGYDFVGESIVANIQVSELPLEWNFERELVLCEVVGQAQYFMLHNEFLKDQREFTIAYLESPKNTLKNKQQ